MQLGWLTITINVSTLKRTQIVCPPTACALGYICCTSSSSWRTSRSSRRIPEWGDVCLARDKLDQNINDLTTSLCHSTRLHRWYNPFMGDLKTQNKPDRPEYMKPDPAYTADISPSCSFPSLHLLSLLPPRCDGVVQRARHVLGADSRSEGVCRQPSWERRSRGSAGLRRHLWLHRPRPAAADPQSEHPGDIKVHVFHMCISRQMFLLLSCAIIYKDTC